MDDLQGYRMVPQITLGFAIFWPNLKVLQDFLMGIKAHFWVIFESSSHKFFCQRVLGSWICHFFFVFVKQILQGSWAQLIEMSP